jgi:hypothetical protein
LTDKHVSGQRTKTSWTYPSRAEANKDREQQLSLVSALDIAKHHLHLDECGAWCIHGETGKVYTWGDDETWVLYVACSSPRQWSSTKQKLSFATVTQDCDQEGCLQLLELPNPKQASLIRQALGIRKARKPILPRDSLDNRGVSASRIVANT